ncbi:MAG: hypothetical protein AAB521_03355, partial [Patescibacteria group bacterium]
DPTSSWKTYTNSRYAYTLDFPTSLRIQEENQTRDTATEATIITSADFTEDTSTCKGGCTYPVTKGWKADISVQKEWTRGFDIDFFRTNPLKITREQDIVNNGIRMFITEHKSVGIPPIGNSSYQVLFVQDANLYRITFEPNKDDFPEGGKLFDQILSTFKFTEASPFPTCVPRPACLDTTPRCLIPETPDMCPSTITSTP